TTHLLLHRGDAAAPPPAGSQKIPPASESTRAPPVEAPLKIRHNDADFALNCRWTLPDDSLNLLKSSVFRPNIAGHFSLISSRFPV
ncbi:UNVERIFIED_CONTAM: hypothetical protein Sindi_1289200, partial [Sesamum indicum]